MRKKLSGEVSHLKSHLGYHLRVISNSVSHSFALKLAASGVTVAEWVILREMYSAQEKISPSEVAELTGLTRGAISKLIERLLAKGLVTRSGSSDDRRYQEITLTNQAIKLVPNLAKIADENDEKFFSVLTQKERKNLMQTLARLKEFHKLNKEPIE